MKYVVVGGGIAGVSCANEILRLERNPGAEVVLVSASTFVKSVDNFRKVGQLGETFDVKEADASEVFADPRLKFVNQKVIGWDAINKAICLENNARVHFDKLCIATGSTPAEHDSYGYHPKLAWNRVLHLRDTYSAKTLQEKLGDAKRVVIVGNGGIATELIYELKNVQITWLVRDSWICAKFFPEDVEKFIEKRLLVGRAKGSKHDGVQKHLQYSTSSAPESSSETVVTESDRAKFHIPGPALGPDWCSGIDFNVSTDSEPREITIIRNASANHFSWPNSQKDVIIGYENLKDKTDHKMRVDLVIWAGGVVPNSDVWCDPRWQLKTTQKEWNGRYHGGICIDDACQTSTPNVFACGDVCALTCSETSPLWNQICLWTQARQFGEVCGRSMVAGPAEARMQNMYFEMFSHCTTFFGLKVVFLGDYKPTRQPEGQWKVVLRDTEEDKLVRCVVVNKVIVGALLIGDTDMEETLENLILNKTNLGDISETFLEPGVDLDDYFD